ncbi:MAG: nitroreductase family protein [Rhabdochlamydiaceae bacterium]
MDSKTFGQDMQSYRPKSTEINNLIYRRWSPRAMSGARLAEKELRALFEAARMAPSAYNLQPWLFLYAEKDSQEWATYFDLLVDFNKSWAVRASYLVAIVSEKTYGPEKKLSPTHSFDSGAAWMCMALEGADRGLVVHAMSGFDYEKAKTALKVPDSHQIEAMVAVGLHGESTELPPSLQEREFPSSRKPIEQIMKKGLFS